MAFEPQYVFPLVGVILAAVLAAFATTLGHLLVFRRAGQTTEIAGTDALTRRYDSVIKHLEERNAQLQKDFDALREECEQDRKEHRAYLYAISRVLIDAGHKVAEMPPLPESY